MYTPRFSTRGGARLLAAPVVALFALAGFTAAPAGASPVGVVSGTGICFGYPASGGCQAGFGGTGTARAGSTQTLGAIFTATDGVADGDQIVLDGTGTGVTFPSTAGSYNADNATTSTGCSVSSVTVDSGGERAFVTMPTECAATFNQRVIVFVSGFVVPSASGTFSLSLSTTHDYTPVGTNTLSVVDAPSAPQLPSAGRNNLSIDVSWSPPASNNGSDLTGYNVYCSDTAPSTSDTPSATTDASTTSTTISGLAAHTTYECIVTAVNGVGESAPSDPVSAAPYQVSTPPQSFSSARGDQSITLYWERPADVGGTPITAYNAYCSTTDLPTVEPSELCGTFGPAQRTGVIRGLTNGVTYFYGMTAVNAAGESELTGISQKTPATVPSRPWAVRANAFKHSLEVRWKVPTSDGGDAITGYDVHCATDPLGVTSAPATTVTTNAARISGLTSGTPYYCAVVANNTVGGSKFSKTATGTPT